MIFYNIDMTVIYMSKQIHRNKHTHPVIFSMLFIDLVGGWYRDDNGMVLGVRLP